MRVLILFWLFVVVGSLVSDGLSSVIHTMIGIPRGVPLPRIGIIGSVAQIFLMMLPFTIASVLTGWIFFRRARRSADKSEVNRFSKSVAWSTVVLSAVYLVVTGAWFAFIQTPPWIILLSLIIPPIVITVTFRILFPLTVRVCVAQDERQSRKEEHSIDAVADNVWTLFEEGYTTSEIAKGIGIGQVNVDSIVEKKRKIEMPDQGFR